MATPVTLTEADVDGQPKVLSRVIGWSFFFLLKIGGRDPLHLRFHIERGQQGTCYPTCAVAGRRLLDGFYGMIKI
jgi:hypothetical protein